MARRLNLTLNFDILLGILGLLVTVWSVYGFVHAVMAISAAMAIRSSK